MNEPTLVRNDRLWLFFVATFGFSWVFWLSVVVFQGVPGLETIMQSMSGLFVLGGIMGPTLIAVIFTYCYKGSAEAKQLLRRGGKRFRAVWLLLVLFLYPLLVVGALAITAFVGNSPQIITNMPQGALGLVSFPVVLVFGGPLLEEYGWRGFALDKLQSRWNGLISSLILGVIWSVWHLPLFFIIGTTQNLLLRYLPLASILFFVMVICLSITFTWIYNNTERSVLGAILLHTIWNTLTAGFFMGVITNFTTDLTTLPLDVIYLFELGNAILVVLLLVTCIIIVLRSGASLDKAEA
jgi:membrane protease YdiL (CAAX protease family)